MTFIDIVIGVAFFSMIFMSLFIVATLSAELVSSTKAKTVGMSLAHDHIENIRSLSYASVGIIGGSPSGIIPASHEIVVHGVTYTVETAVVYADDPTDGVGQGDSDGNPNDYKRVHIEVSWDFKQEGRSFALVTLVAPSAQ